MISGPHQHKCRICNERFECSVITHCGLDSNDVRFVARPVCYKARCRELMSEELLAERPTAESEESK